MLFERVDRVVGLVGNLDRAKAFFADLFEIPFDETIVDPVHQLRIVHAGRFGLEIGSPMSHTHPLAAAEMAWLKQHGDGLRFVVIKVSDLDAGVKRFADRGIKALGSISVGDAKEAFFDPKSTFGIPIVLNEYPDPHPMSVQAFKSVARS